MGRKSHRSSFVAALALFIGVAFAGQLASAVSGTLPGGTPISVSITAPTNGQTFTVATPTSTVDVTVQGNASIGSGDGGKDTTLAYVMDRSTSMDKDAGVNCDGASGNDKRIVCERRAVIAANQKAALSTSNIALAGLAHFGPDGIAADVDRGTPGTQHLVAPDFDSTDQGTTHDVEEVANAVAIGQAGTDYSEGLKATFQVLNDAANTQPHNLVIFLSDGRNNSGANVNTLQASVPAHTMIRSFAIGTDVNCDSRNTAGGGLGSLQEVANLSTEGPGSGTTTGICKVVTDMSKLGDEISAAIGGSVLDSLTRTVDGGTARTLTNAEVDPDLPQNGPASVTFSFVEPGLGVGDHTICVKANGHDSGGNGNVQDCVTIHVVSGPTKKTPTLTTTPDPASGVTGENYSDHATLSDAGTPTATGNIVFNLYPNDTCTGAVFTSTPVTVNGNGTYDSQSTQINSAGTYHWVATYSGDSNYNTVSTACTDEKVEVTQAPQGPTMTGRAWGLSLGGLLPIDPTPDTGPIETQDAGVFPPESNCVLDLGVATVLCSQVETFTDPEALSGASAHVATVDLALGLLPEIRAKAVSSSSGTSCDTSEGGTTIAFLAVGDSVIIPSPTPIPPNTGIDLGIVKIMLNEQIETVSAGERKLEVNAIHITILNTNVVDLIVSHSESDIHDCT